MAGGLSTLSSNGRDRSFVTFNKAFCGDRQTERSYAVAATFEGNFRNHHVMPGLKSQYLDKQVLDLYIDQVIVDNAVYVSHYI